MSIKKGWYKCYECYPEILRLHMDVCSYGNIDLIKKTEKIMDKYRSTIGMSFNYKPVFEMVMEELENIKCELYKER